MISAMHNSRKHGSDLVSYVKYGIGRVKRVFQEGSSDAVMHYGGFKVWQRELAEMGFGNLGTIRMLDVGCGDRAPLAVMFATSGAAVEAIDLLPVRVSWQRPWMWLACARQRGWTSAVRQAGRDTLHTWRYWHELRRLMGAPLAWTRITFRKMDAERLRFPDSAFDVVYSSAVWEHVGDVRRATREVNRVLSPAGIAVIQIALFPALTGGHHAEWHTVALSAKRDIRPWDHLRAGARPLPLYCNGWREAQYVRVFEEEMEIQRWDSGPLAGKQYLTPELSRELRAYSERDLLLPWITVWARKRRETQRSSADE